MKKSSLNPNNIPRTFPQHALSRSNKVSPQHGCMVVFICITSLEIVCTNFTCCSLLYFLGVFSESTAKPFELYGKDTSDFVQASKFVQFVCDLCKIVLLKSPSKGDRT